MSTFLCKIMRHVLEILEDLTLQKHSSLPWRSRARNYRWRMYPLSAVLWSGSILGFTIFGGLQNTCMSTTRCLGVGRQVYIQHTFPSHVYLIHRSLKVLLCSSLRLCFGWASSREVGCGIFHCGIVWALGAFWVFEHFRFGIRGWGRISFLTHILLGFVCAALSDPWRGTLESDV